MFTEPVSFRVCVDCACIIPRTPCSLALGIFTATSEAGLPTPLSTGKKGDPEQMAILQPQAGNGYCQE